MRPGDPVYINGRYGVFYVATNPKDGHVLLSQSKARALEIYKYGAGYGDAIIACLDSLRPHVGAPKRASSGAQTLEQLRQVERQKGYKPGWADHVYRARMAKAYR
jgi:hypothetical protein